MELTAMSRMYIDVDLLPKEFVGLPNGHSGSHQFLVHDFVTACVTGQTPPNNVWDAARYLVAGLSRPRICLAGRSGAGSPRLWCPSLFGDKVLGKDITKDADCGRWR